MKSISIVDEMKLIGEGDHMVLLYDDDDDYNTDIIASFIITRLDRNEKCFYIAGDSDVELLKQKIAMLIDLNTYIVSGQLTLLSKEDAYSKEGYFNPDKMIALLQQLSKQAIEEGYKAFAITGEISWVLDYDDGFERIMEYEYKLNKMLFNEYPVSAICRYNMKKFTSQMIKNIIEVHPIIIWKGQIHDNPFYTDVVDGSDIDLDQYQVVSMLNRISEFTNIKSRFNQELERQKKTNRTLEMNLMKNVIQSVTSLLEIHDKYTSNHSENVAKMARDIAKSIGFSQSEITELYLAGLVHDIGKTIIPSNILNKKATLSDEEYSIVQRHSLYGYEVLVKTKELAGIALIVKHHHERYDGNGYPMKLSGNDIPIGSRILAVVDSYDAMVNDRPYRSAICKEDAINELIRCKGSQFDTVLVDAFIKLYHDEYKSLKINR